ncbi:MAG: TIGR03617 family F420-dependent LLM class oxidoreductase [Thermoplasmata archaeon]
MPAVKLDAFLHPSSPAKIPSLALSAEDLGFDGLWFGETSHDALLACALAAEHTERVEVGTAIALAFTRSPMALAYTCWDVQSIARGRLILGLGSQVKGHVERRFSLQWVPPVPKMREVIQALRAIWSCWQSGEPLSFRGRHYSFSLMTPFFNPGPIEHPEIPIYLAAVNRGMARLAGELCQGLHVHPLHTVAYIRKVLKPAVEEGARKTGGSADDVSFAASTFVALGRNREEMERSKEVMREQVAFYASTRTYRAVLDLHGWGALGDKLHKLSVEGRWDEMGSQVPPDVLEEFVIEARFDELADAIRSKYGGLLNRVSLYLPFDPHAEWWSTFLRAFKGATGR